MPTSEYVTVAFYRRTSSDEEHQKYSLEAQKHRLRDFARAQYGSMWALHSDYCDQASGTRLDRPGLVRLLRHARRRLFSVLLVYSIDRLSRKTGHLVELVDEFTRCGVAVRSTTERLDTSDPAGMMMLQMLGVFAEFEHSAIVQRAVDARKQKAWAGGYAGGHIAYGYRNDRQRGIMVNSTEAQAVRLAFEARASGERLDDIARTLVRRGFRPRIALQWGSATLVGMLRNPIYTGRPRHFGKVLGRVHEPIVPDNLFERVQATFRDGPSVRREYVLKGLLFCARCGRRLWMHTCGPGRYAYCPSGCTQRWLRSDLLERGLVSSLGHNLRHLPFARRLLEQIDHLIAEKKRRLASSLKATEAEFEERRAELGRFIEAMEGASLNRTSQGRNAARMRERLLVIQERKADLLERLGTFDVTPMTLEQLRRRAGQLEEEYAGGNAEEVRGSVLNFVRKVVVDYGRYVEVWCRVPPSQTSNARARKALVLPGVDVEPIEFGMVLNFTLAARRPAEPARAYLVDPRSPDEPSFSAIGPIGQPPGAMTAILDACGVLGPRRPAKMHAAK